MLVDILAPIFFKSKKKSNGLSNFFIKGIHLVSKFKESFFLKSESIFFDGKSLRGKSLLCFKKIFFMFTKLKLLGTEKIKIEPGFNAEAIDLHSFSMSKDQ